MTDINEFKKLLNEVHESVYDWCKMEARDNYSFTELMRGCNHVISEMSKKIDNLCKIES